MEDAGWVATCVDKGDWSMNDREALGDFDLAGVDEKTETLPVLLLFAAIESKSSDALIGKECPVISYSVKVLPTTPFCCNQQAPIQTFLGSNPKFRRHFRVHSGHFYEPLVFSSIKM